LNKQRIYEAESFDEGLRMLLETLIDLHRDQKPILAATEVEVLSNLDAYSRLAESVDVRSLMETDARPVIEVLQALLERHPEERLALTGREAMLHKVVDVLIHRFVYVEPTFGSEGEFIETLTKIIRALIT
jgi:hypothetical protein